jgi:hypothetical protein
MGRRVVTVFFTSLTGLLIAYGATAIHRDTFNVPAGGTPDSDCSAGIHRLHDAYARVWDDRRENRDTMPVPDALEHDLLALRPRCESEGAAASDAYEALLRWRYRAESQTHVWTTLLSNEAQRALGYQSPSSAAVLASPSGSSR